MAGVATSTIVLGAISAAIAAAGTGYALSGAGNPQYPDLASSSKQMSDLQAGTLPYRRMLEAAAQQGSKIEIPKYDNVKQVQLNGQWLSETDPKVQAYYKNFVPTRGAAQSPGLPSRMVKVQNGTRTIDFTGLGAADVQAKLADEMAKIQLDLSQKYDSQFIDQALEQEKLADPESFAARQKMDELIQKQINTTPERPVADLLDKQISDQLAAAKDSSLTPEMRDVLDKSVTDALAARGGQSAGGDFSTPLTTGFEGEQRQAAARAKALSWLGSGETPEDVEYRREQQNLANLSAQVNGRTPESQFSSLSAAQNGPTPFQPGQQLSTMPGNQGYQFNQMQANATQNAAMNPGVNNWIAGTSAMLGTAENLNKAGLFK